MHALNNAIGRAWQTIEDMQYACDNYLASSYHEGMCEIRAEHAKPSGWYSIEVMAKAVTSTCMQKHGRVDHIMNLEPLSVNPAALLNCLGAVVNIQNAHWVALRWFGEQVWLLDSQQPQPVSLTWREYLDFVRAHKDAYCIEAAPEMAHAAE